MKLVFFGSSHGSPEPNRRCSSTMIEVGGNRYFVDMGTQSVEGLIDRGIPVESVRAIFVTHMHGDHTNGLVSFLDLCSWRFRDANPTVCLPGDAQATQKALADWLLCNGTHLRPFAFQTVREGLVFDDGILRVTAYKTMHTEFSYAYLIEAEGRRVLFSGDLSHSPAKDFPMAALAPAPELAICEAAHFKATEYISVFSGDHKPKRLCFNHYSSRYLGSLAEAKEAFLQEMDVLLATDGLEISL